MGTHLRVLSESYPINTNMTGFRTLDGFHYSLPPCALDESSFSIGKVKGNIIGPGEHYKGIPTLKPFMQAAYSLDGSVMIQNQNKVEFQNP